MYTVFMPRDFDDDVWRCRPGDWEPELRRRRKVGKDGCAEFCVAVEPRQNPQKTHKKT